MTAILLIPLKLLLKAAAYVFAAVLGTAAIIITIASVFIQKIASFVGGMIIIAAILMALMAATDTCTILTSAGIGIAIILMPLIIDGAAKLISQLKEVIIEGASEIELL